MESMLFLVPFAILATILAFESARSQEESEKSWKGDVIPSIYLQTMNNISDENPERRCMWLCHRVNVSLIEDNCAEDAVNETELLQPPTIDESDILPLNITDHGLQNYFSFNVRHRCADSNQSLLISHKTDWYLLSNGSVLRSSAEKLEDRLVNHRRYCLPRIKQNEQSYHEYRLFHCANIIEQSKEEEDDDIFFDRMYLYTLLISVPFLIATYLVYWLLPELNTLHGLTLRGYVSSMAIMNFSMAITLFIKDEWLSDVFCIVIGLVISFSFSATYFWLNVMCFDIWWTFRKTPLQRNIKHQDNKRFLMYSTFAWGSAFVHTIICIIMDVVPILPKDFRPEFYTCTMSNKVQVLYFWAPMTIIIICNTCLFISTTVKILNRRRNIEQHLKSSESRRHDSNKQRFSLYLKLFLIMGLSWFVDVMFWLLDMLSIKVPDFLSYIETMINMFQGLTIFVICVWKDKIWHLLLKRLGCQDRDFCKKSKSNNRDNCVDVPMHETAACNPTYQ